MFLNVSVKSTVRISFYLILIGVSITSLIKLLDKPTAFEEKVVYNKAILPSFTVCPLQPDQLIGNKTIESFEDIEKATEHVRLRYTIEYQEYKAYEQFKTDKSLYNDTSYGAWYFAPQISSYPPVEIVICLIWTPSREHKIKEDWNILVSYCATQHSRIYPQFINTCGVFLRSVNSKGKQILFFTHNFCIKYSLVQSSPHKTGKTKNL